ncbi:Uncharacterised protein [Mycobacteroides abscessus subsp. abscessus]|nr:Uncharacterised protein [Mycobacteroides abscessus subsp. abscessus]
MSASAPHDSSTIPATADDRDPTTGVPDASDSNADRQNVSCGPGANETSVLANSAATSRRSRRWPRNVTGRPLAACCRAPRMGPSPAMTRCTGSPAR